MCEFGLIVTNANILFCCNIYFRVKKVARIRIRSVTESFACQQIFKISQINILKDDFKQEITSFLSLATEIVMNHVSRRKRHLSKGCPTLNTFGGLTFLFWRFGCSPPRYHFGSCFQHSCLAVLIRSLSVDLTLHVRLLGGWKSG